MLANEGWRAAVVMSMNNVTSNALADISAEEFEAPFLPLAWENGRQPRCSWATQR